MARITVRPGPARPVHGSGCFGISGLRTCRFLWKEWPHDTPGAPAAGEKRPYPDGPRYMQPQLAPASAIDESSRAAPRPTGGPITQREAKHPADGFPNAEYLLPAPSGPRTRSECRSSQYVRIATNQFQSVGCGLLPSPTRGFAWVIKRACIAVTRRSLWRTTATSVTRRARSMCAIDCCRTACCQRPCAMPKSPDRRARWRLRWPRSRRCGPGWPPARPR